MSDEIAVSLKEAINELRAIRHRYSCLENELALDIQKVMAVQRRIDEATDKLEDELDKRYYPTPWHRMFGR